jgi:hypothetical protein
LEFSGFDVHDVQDTGNIVAAARGVALTPRMVYDDVARLILTVVAVGAFQS